MIKIAASIQRAFIFPAEPQLTLTYYSELSRVAQFMPHISLVKIFTPHQVRVLYHTVELGTYSIRIFTDLEGKVDRENQTISVIPVKLAATPPIPLETTMRETVAPGLFAIDAQLFDMGEQTRIEATLRLQANLKRPYGMNLMPKRVVNRIANSITDNRMKEMADGFIKASVKSFPDWLIQHQTKCVM